MRLAETGGAFDFLHDEREDVYTVKDLRVRYRKENTSFVNRDNLGNAESETV